MLQLKQNSGSVVVIMLSNLSQDLHNCPTWNCLGLRPIQDRSVALPDVREISWSCELAMQATFGIVQCGACDVHDCRWSWEAGHRADSSASGCYWTFLR
jgi:hypothetical protein